MAIPHFLYLKTSDEKKDNGHRNLNDRGK
jgi:hypothetical protein